MGQLLQIQPLCLKKKQHYGDHWVNVRLSALQLEGCGSFVPSLSIRAEFQTCGNGGGIWFEAIGLWSSIPIIALNPSQSLHLYMCNTLPAASYSNSTNGAFHTLTSSTYKFHWSNVSILRRNTMRSTSKSSLWDPTWRGMLLPLAPLKPVE